MSTNVRSNARLTAQVRQLLTSPAQASLMALGGGGRLRELAACAGLLPTQPLEGQVAAEIRSMLADSRLEDFVRTAGPQAQEALASVRAGMAAGGSLPAQETASLFVSLGSTAGRMERSVLADIVVTTLREDLGVASIRRADGPNATGVEARFADGGCLLVAVEPDSIVTDQADAVGLCAGRQHALEQGLRHRGVEINRIAGDPHDQTVGPLIARATRVHAPSLAHAIAGFSEPHPQPTTRPISAAAAPRASKRSRLEQETGR